MGNLTEWFNETSNFNNYLKLGPAGSLYNSLMFCTVVFYDA